MQLLKEGEQGVGGLVPAGGNAERGSAVESLLFERLIGMDECRQDFWPHCLHEFWPQCRARMRGCRGSG